MSKVHESDQWAPPGFKGEYRSRADGPIEHQVLSDLLALVGYSATAEQIAGWPLRAIVEAETYAANVHLRASDNVMRAHPKPSWFPEPWLGPEEGDGVFRSPGGTELPSPPYAADGSRAS